MVKVRRSFLLDLQVCNGCRLHQLLCQIYRIIPHVTPVEVAVLNGLSVNLHLLLASFFRPQGRRRRILIDGPCFPSDRFVVETHLAWHGIDARTGLAEVGIGEDGAAPDDDAIEEAIESGGEEIALVLLGGVNYLTGRLLDVDRLVRAVRGWNGHMLFE